MTARGASRRLVDGPLVATVTNSGLYTMTRSSSVSVHSRNSSISDSNSGGWASHAFFTSTPSRSLSVRATWSFMRGCMMGVRSICEHSGSWWMLPMVPLSAALMAARSIAPHPETRNGCRRLRNACRMACTPRSPRANTTSDPPSVTNDAAVRSAASPSANSLRHSDSSTMSNDAAGAIDPPPTDDVPTLSASSLPPPTAPPPPPPLVLTTAITPTLGVRENLLLKFSSRFMSSILKYFISSIVFFTRASFSAHSCASFLIRWMSSGRLSRLRKRSSSSARRAFRTFFCSSCIAWALANCCCSALVSAMWSSSSLSSSSRCVLFRLSFMACSA
mmetsp:Transcript_2031/g.6527  ORF Transcript_2031/g.6527 Transcript_2031/m.6527 type:complete len:333 (-) Transcript_2031:2877-3875(-)